MLWDVFCRVIDNFGDIGVCWRLARDLGARGHAVRLWVDDPGALAWMAPEVTWSRVSVTCAHEPHLRGLDGLSAGQGQEGVTVLRWDEAERHLSLTPECQPGEVVIEAFGCNPPDAFVERMQRPAPPAWINLEYLSAEAYVERSHGLPSPVGSGPGKGLVKRFFYPGFTPATGGLLREPRLIDQAERQWQAPVQRVQWLRQQGVIVPPEAALISLFCYASAPVSALLDRLAEQPTPVAVLLTPGHATELGMAWAQQRAKPSPGLSLHSLPALAQPDFDRLLWSCDLNFVRGEDSAVRALWAGKPHVWQIYEQDDGVHADTLNAFMDRWMSDWPPTLRAQVSAWWLAWNQLGPMPAALPDWHGAGTQWASSAQASRLKLTLQTDLSTQLTQFVTRSG
jgi:uncharacterized repeat protein (TIGR03837 family)